MRSDDQVNVRRSAEWLSFAPARGSEPQAGFIMYPGSEVPPEAYAPLARKLAEKGHLAVILKVPLRLAFLGEDRAAIVQERYPEVRRWAVGGHSMGGVIAGDFAERHPNTVEGLALLGSYLKAGDDLSKAKIDVVSIEASNDPVVDRSAQLAGHARLPAGRTVIVSIDGGNHDQFGWYSGLHREDGRATMSREGQTESTADAIASLLARISARATARPDQAEDR